MNSKTKNVSEYVGFTSSEKGYSQKNFLQSQLELLNSAKRFKVYKKLRDEEFILKINLKSKIGEMLERLEKLERILPKSRYGLEGGTTGEPEAKRNSLEKEIGEIRKKLEKLQS